MHVYIVVVFWGYTHHALWILWSLQCGIQVTSSETPQVWYVRIPAEGHHSVVYKYTRLETTQVGGIQVHLQKDTPCVVYNCTCKKTPWCGIQIHLQKTPQVYYFRIWTLGGYTCWIEPLCVRTNLLPFGQYCIYLWRSMSVANFKDVSDMSIIHYNTLLMDGSEG